MAELMKTTNKTYKKQQSKKSSSPNKHISKKQPRKAENPIRLSTASEQSPDFGYLNTWICKNSACRAVLSINNTFCKRCSCCICYLFDDNKDPSLWLVCTSESGEEDSCGLSCHIECALRREKVGVVDLGQLMQLDGSYCCASCGKVSGILGIWKKQLLVAKEARRVDVLWHRICLSYKLLDGTSKFKELHDIVKEAKTKLEEELGPINGDSGTMVRGIVSRLSIAGDVLKLCSQAIEKADEWLATNVSSADPNREGSLPAACKFLFEEVTPSSVVIILIDPSSASTDEIKGYKLWHFKSREESQMKEPTCTFSRSQRQILISNLLPCTEYTFRIISYTETGDLGHSEAKCFTKSVEIIHKNLDSPVCRNNKKENLVIEANTNAMRESETTIAAVPPSEFKVRDLGNILRLAQAQQKGPLESFCSVNKEKCCGPSIPIKTETFQESPSVPCGLDLNVLSMPDLNEELTPPFESSGDEDNGYTLQQTVEADDAASRDMVNNVLARSHGSGDSQTCTRGITVDTPAVDSRAEIGRKRKAISNEETHDCDSTLINGPPLQNGSSCLDENFEYCVKIIRWLECEGHLTEEFRLKLLTWFSLRSTEQERRVVNTFIQTMIDDPSSLAGQLVDSFSDIISRKRQQKGSAAIFPSHHHK